MVVLVLPVQLLAEKYFSLAVELLEHTPQRVVHTTLVQQLVELVGGYGGVGPHGAGDQGGSGLPNSGGGGGGTASYNSLGGNGGSGIVIIRYKIF